MWEKHRATTPLSKRRSTGCSSKRQKREKGRSTEREETRFVLGRGGEEAEALVKNGISFEMVPGVSSAVAVPAYAGIPVTHRGVASSFTVVTGHKASDQGEPKHCLGSIGGCAQTHW